MCTDEIRFGCKHRYKRIIPCKWPKWPTKDDEDRGRAKELHHEAAVPQPCDRYTNSYKCGSCPGCRYYHDHHRGKLFDESQVSPETMAYIEKSMEAYPPSYSQQIAPPGHRPPAGQARSLARSESTYSFTSNTTYTMYSPRSTQGFGSPRTHEEPGWQHSSVIEERPDDPTAAGVLSSPSSIHFAAKSTKSIESESEATGSRPSSMTRLMQKLSGIEWHRSSKSSSIRSSQSSRGFWDMFSVRNRSDESMVCAAAREIEQKFV